MGGLGSGRIAASSCPHYSPGAGNKGVIFSTLAMEDEMISQSERLFRADQVDLDFKDFELGLLSRGRCRSTQRHPFSAMGALFGGEWGSPALICRLMGHSGVFPPSFKTPPGMVGMMRMQAGSQKHASLNCTSAQLRPD